MCEDFPKYVSLIIEGHIFIIDKDILFYRSYHISKFCDIMIINISGKLIEEQEQIVGDFYDKLSPRLLKEWDVIRNTSSLHFGYHTFKTTSLGQSFKNMNDYVAKLLGINL